MGVYVVMNFPSNYALDQWGCRNGVSLTKSNFIGHDWHSSDSNRHVDKSLYQSRILDIDIWLDDSSHRSTFSHECTS